MPTMGIIKNIRLAERQSETPGMNTFDYVIIGSGFGGSVSAMRLTEKGYSVLVLEKGKRFRDQDFARSNWQFWKYIWMPSIRAHGILQISILTVSYTHLTLPTSDLV